MLGRRLTNVSVRQRPLANQENAANAMGRPAAGKPVLGKPRLGIQTRARAALGDRSNTYHVDQAKVNQGAPKLPMAKKEVQKELPVTEKPKQQHTAGNTFVTRARRFAKAAVSATARPKTQQPPQPEVQPPEQKIVEEAPDMDVENVAPAADHEEDMDVDETSVRIDDTSPAEITMTTPSKESCVDDDENERLPTCERVHRDRYDERQKIRLQVVDTYGGGIGEPGQASAHRITNPDLTDLPNTQMVSDYVYDIFDYLQDLELRRMPLTPKFLSHCTEISSRMRYVLVDWMVQIHSRFEMLPETLYLGIGLMDRYLSTGAGIEINKDNLQMLGVTSMMVAAKFEEMYPPDITDFTYVTGNAYTNQQLREFEWKLLSRLGFFCTLPTPITFLRRFSRLIQATSEMHAAAKYFLELSTTESSICYYPGCLRAASAICLADTLLRHAPIVSNVKNGHTDEYLKSLISDAWLPNLQFSAAYHVNDIYPVLRKIALVAGRQTAPSKYRAIYNKYVSPEVHSIALRPELRSPLLSLLAAEDVDV